jgi:hypothetical protein
MVGAQQERAFWAGLYFHDTSSADNVLEHVEVAHAGGDDWTGGLSNAGVFVREGGVQLTIRNSSFLENGTAALLLHDASADLTIESSTFENNDMPVSSVANTVGAIASDNSFSGNDASYVRLNGRGSESRVTTAQTWSALGIPVRVGTDVIVESDLTVAPGATITFEEEIGFLVAGGSLAADGRGGDLITFTAADGSTPTVTGPASGSQAASRTKTSSRMLPLSTAASTSGSSVRMTRRGISCWTMTARKARSSPSMMSTSSAAAARASRSERARP